MLATQQIAPDFTLPAADGTLYQLSALKGRKIVLYFYPKDDTPGCTVEALDFTALAPQFEAAGTMVIGISKDSCKKHAHFTQKHNLNVLLLSDEQHDTCENYHVWVQKSMYGKSYMGIERTTFLIDHTGKITHIWPKVSVKDHAADVLEAVRAS